MTGHEQVIGGLLLAAAALAAGWLAHKAAESWRHRQCTWQDGYDACERDTQGDLDELDAAVREARDDAALWRDRAEDMRARHDVLARRAAGPPLAGAVHPPRRHDTGTNPAFRRNLAHLARERFDDLPHDDGDGTPSAPRRAAMLAGLAPDALDAEQGRFGPAHERDLPSSPRPAVPAEPQIAAVGDAAFISTDEFEQARAAVLAAHGEMPPSLQRVIDAGGRFAMPPRRPRPAAQRAAPRRGGRRARRDAAAVAARHRRGRPVRDAAAPPPPRAAARRAAPCRAAAAAARPRHAARRIDGTDPRYHRRAPVRRIGVADRPDGRARRRVVGLVQGTHRPVRARAPSRDHPVNDERVPALLVEGKWAGKRLHVPAGMTGVMNCAPPAERWPAQLPEPPRWRWRARARWERHPRGRHYRLPPPLPLQVYRYAGTLDDGTRVFLFDAKATWGDTVIPSGASGTGPGSRPL